MNGLFRAYCVWPHFPTFSMSGNACALHCKHCNHTFLEDMQALPTPESLLDFVHKQNEDDLVGFLLSGGCDHQGRMLYLRRFLPIINKIKQQTDLIVKLHTGFVDASLAEEIVAAGVDIASVEVVGSNETIQSIFDFQATCMDFQNSLEHLERAGMPYIVPHICIGLDRGKLKGEFQALSMIKESCTPSSLVMIVLWPTKGTALAQCPPPSIEDMQRVIRKAAEMFPHKDVSLGCMRPRGRIREAVERAAVDSGVNRMELPSKKTLQHVTQKGMHIKRIGACCALPTELEHSAVLTKTKQLTHPCSL